MQYLKIWMNFQEIIEPLSDEETGRLFRMMLKYADTGEAPEAFPGNERFIWPAAKQIIDSAETKAEILRQNGLKGGRPKTKENQTEANKSKTNQTEANESLKVKVNVNIKDKVNSNKRFTPPTLQEVTDYCQERGNSVNPERFIDFYASKGWKVGNQPMKDWKACVRTWEQREAKSTKTVIAQNYDQRDYTAVQDQIMQRQNERLMKRLQEVV